MFIIIILLSNPVLGKACHMSMRTIGNLVSNGLSNFYWSIKNTQSKLNFNIGSNVFPLTFIEIFDWVINHITQTLAKNELVATKHSRNGTDSDRRQRRQETYGKCKLQPVFVTNFFLDVIVVFTKVHANQVPVRLDQKQFSISGKILLKNLNRRFASEAEYTTNPIPRMCIWVSLVDFN